MSKSEKTQTKNVNKNSSKEEKSVKKNVKDKKVVKKEIVEEKVKDSPKVSEEKVTKKETKVKKNNSDKAVTVLKKIDDYRISIILFVVGFLIATLLFRCILWPDRIATLKDGTQPVATFNGETITADDLYENMKEYYSVNVLVNEIDDMILTEIYPDSDEIDTQVTSTAEYYYSLYEQSYGYTKEEFLSEYGFENEEAFLENLKLDYRRNEYYEDYAASLVTDKEIEEYYEDEVFGDVDSKHILVSIDEEEGLTSSEAKSLAEEIIAKLNKGTSWDDVIKEYKDQIINEELGYNAFNASLESTYLEECKNLNVDSYSKTPVLTSYGYHIVYKIDQKDKPELDDVKDDVIEILASEKKSADTNLYYKALINMREEANLEFVDTKLGEEYKTYVSNYK